jgi:hypothetical protein
MASRRCLSTASSLSERVSFTASKLARMRSTEVLEIRVVPMRSLRKVK